MLATSKFAVSCILFIRRILLCVLALALANAAIGQSARYISPEEFGAVGTGQDETQQILRAFSYAKQHRLPVRLNGGKTYVFSPRQTVDITGIPAIEGDGTFDVSNTGKNAGNPGMLAIFQITGKKKLLAQNVRGIEQGKHELTITSNLPLQPGDTLFCTSSEPLDNRRRPYYCKGQSAIVRSYDLRRGVLVVDKPFFYNIRSAYLWKCDYQPSIRIGQNVGFVTSPMNFITCFRFYYARAYVSGNFKNFSLTAIMFKSSFGEVKKMTAELPIDSNNGYSHCIEVGDMSDVNIIDCRLSGGRHVISGIGGGLWKQDESGGKGNAGYPSRLTVDGGEYRGTKSLSSNGITADIATVDSHGVIQEMCIRNCTIYGGINLGANLVTVDNCKIFTDGKNAFNIGSDVEPGSDWGHFTIRNSVVTDNDSVLLPAVYGKADVDHVVFDNVQFEKFKDPTVLFDLKNFSPKNMLINNVRSKGYGGRNSVIISKRSRLRINRSTIDISNIRKVD